MFHTFDSGLLASGARVIRCGAEIQLGKQTSGKWRACQMGRSEPCAFDSARTQRRFLFFLLLRPWRGLNWQS